MTQQNQKRRNRVYFAINLSLLILQWFFYTPAYSSGLVTQSASLKYVISSDDTIPLSFPSDVASNSKQVFIVDGGNHRLVVFDKRGNHLFSFGSYGMGEGQFNYPVGLFVTNKHVYVADAGNHRVQVFTVKGEYISSFSLRHNGKSVRPIDLIVYSRTGNIIVTASETHSLMVFTPQGKLIDQWGGNGMNQGEFRYPATITEMPDGRIAVVDVLNTRVQVFDSKGDVSMTVSDWGVLQGQLVRPKGVAVDNKSNFYVSDSYMNLVQIFSETGQFISVLGEQGKPYEMVTPVGMLVDDNHLYIVEMRANRVSVYQLE